MKPYLLLPNKFRLIGWLFFTPGFILGVANRLWGFTISGGFLRLRDKNGFFTDANADFTNELALALVILGIMFIAFAKLKNEDELTSKLRLNAWYWAILANYILVICLFAASSMDLEFSVRYKIDYLEGNLYVPLLAFIVRFWYLLYKNKNEYNVAPLRFLPHSPYNKIARIAALPCVGAFVICWVIRLGNFLTEAGWVDYLERIYFILPLVLLFWMYSKEGMEDEYINFLRLRAMQISVYINSMILLMANFSLYSLDFLVFEILALSILPVTFVIVFQYSLYRLFRNSEEKSRKALNIKIYNAQP